jgi:hypothetical protein
LVCFVDTLPCAAQVDGLTLWVKRTDFRDAPYFITRHVARDCLVADFIARWVASEKLDVTPSLVSLRLVSYTGEEEPTPEQEAFATVLQPRKTLAQAGVSDGSWLLAVFAQAAPSAGAPRALHTGYD